jgi:hypothetical protein
VALLHVAAVLDPEVKNTRLQAWADPFTWNDILAMLRRLYTDHKYVDNLPESPQLSITTDLTQSLGLLKKWAGQNGWRNLEQTVVDNMEPIIALERK